MLPSSFLKFIDCCIYLSIKFVVRCKALVAMWFYLLRPFSAAPPRRKDANRQCGNLTLIQKVWFVTCISVISVKVDLMPFEDLIPKR